jgi:hypothetical protein
MTVSIKPKERRKTAESPLQPTCTAGSVEGMQKRALRQGVRARRVPIQSRRERLASLTRQCRHAAQRLETLETGMYLIGSTYNFCWPHHEVRNSKQFGYLCTPALAAGLTAPIWSVSEVLSFKVAPAPWVEPKRRGRPRQATRPDLTLPQRPRGRPRKVA